MGLNAVAGPTGGMHTTAIITTATITSDTTSGRYDRAAMTSRLLGTTVAPYPRP